MRDPDIFLVTPSSSARAIEKALTQNHELASLPQPLPKILAPSSLTQTSGTAEILRIPEVRNAITTDFLVLPCDLVCEIPGQKFLDAWMTHQAGLGGSLSFGGDRRGGLGVWYFAKGEGSSKQDETDFVITTPWQDPVPAQSDQSPNQGLQRVLNSATKDTLSEIVEEKDGLPLRTRLLETYGRVKLLTHYRDAHAYFLPHWVLELINHNEFMDTISEDVVGWWARTAWQPELAKKMNLDQILQPPASEADEVIDIAAISSTGRSETSTGGEKSSLLTVPPILGYFQDPEAQVALIRRVDTASLLLSTSLRLAKLATQEDAGHSEVSPFAHASRIASPEGIAQRTTVNRSDCLLADNVKVESQCNIKETVLGANCEIKSGCRISRCVLMDGTVVGERCELTGCVVGCNVRVGRETSLVDCEIQDGNTVQDGTEAKGEKFMVFEGLEADENDVADDLRE